MYPVQKCPPQRCSGQKCPQKHPPQNRPPQNRPPQKCPPQKYLPQNILLRNILLRYAYQDFSIFRRRLPITGNYVIFLCNGYPQSCQIYPKYWIFIAKISQFSYKNWQQFQIIRNWLPNIGIYASIASLNSHPKVVNYVPKVGT